MFPPTDGTREPVFPLLCGGQIMKRPFAIRDRELRVIADDVASYSGHVN